MNKMKKNKVILIPLKWGEKRLAMYLNFEEVTALKREIHDCMYMNREAARTFAEGNVCTGTHRRAIMKLLRDTKAEIEIDFLC